MSSWVVYHLILKGFSELGEDKKLLKAIVVKHFIFCYFCVFTLRILANLMQ